MTAIVSVHEAKTHLSRLLERVHAGEEIILAKAGQPYARLVPIHPEIPTRRPGRLKGSIGEAFFEPLPEDELRAWERDEWGHGWMSGCGTWQLPNQKYR
jgi:prevent-host-death family protein